MPPAAVAVLKENREQDKLDGIVRSNRVEWKGTWGPLNDYRSKLGRLVKAIEKELTEEHGPFTERQRRIAKSVARLEALATMTGDEMGKDPKATRRTLSALERAALSRLTQLKSSLTGRREPAFDPVAEFGKKGIEP